MVSQVSISEEFRTRLSQINTKERIDVLVTAAKPKGLDGALEGLALRNSPGRRNIVKRYNQDALVPVHKYLSERGITYEDNIVMRCTAVSLTKNEIIELAGQPYVATIIEDQKVHLP